MGSQDLPVFEPLPTQQPVDILFVAGEHSGDEHAARLLQKCRQSRPELHVAAIGGTQLKNAGAHLLFNPLENAVVGLVEVFKHFDYLSSLFKQTSAWIAQHQPKVVCFVDYPGFNLRLASRLFKSGIAKKAGGTVSLVYYISPQIWAWKAKRRFAMERHLDGLGVIFPFELEAYADTSLPVTFVGHPFVDKDYEIPVSHDPTADLLLLPGSRRTPISRIFPVMVETFYKVKAELPELKAQVMYPTEEIRNQLSDLITQRGDASDFELIPNSESFRARAVLTSSGTISLVCALAGIPGILVYRTNPITYAMAKWLVKIPRIGIANIILERSIHPEYLQAAMRPDSMANELIMQLKDPDCLQRTRELSRELTEKLASPDPQTSARWLLSFLG